MSKQTIGIGTVANDGTGDPLRTAFTKVNANDTELYKVAHPGYVANNWYLPITRGNFNAGNAVGSGSIRLVLGYVADKITLNALGARITTAAAAGNIQLAIYANNAATGRPTGSALASTSSISTTSTGSVNSAVSVQLDVGWYWFAVNADNATVVIASTLTTNSGFAELIGSTTQANALSSTGSMVALTVTQTFGTWPDLTAGSFTENNTTNIGPLVQFKVASIP